MGLPSASMHLKVAVTAGVVEAEPGSRIEHVLSKAEAAQDQVYEFRVC